MGNTPENRRSVLKMAGLTIVGSGTIGSQSVSAGSNKQYSGIAYLPAKDKLVGNVEAKINQSNNKFHGALDFTEREGVDSSPLHGAFPDSREVRVSKTEIPNSASQGYIKKVNQAAKQNRKLDKKASIDMTKTKIPVKGEQLRSKTKVQGKVMKKYRQHVRGRLARGGTPTTTTTTKHGDLFTGTITAPNRKQRIGYVVTPKSSGMSEDALIEVLKNE